MRRQRGALEAQPRLPQSRCLAFELCMSFRAKVCFAFALETKRSKSNRRDQNLIALPATTKPVAKDNRKARQAGQNWSQVATSLSSRAAAQLSMAAGKYFLSYFNFFFVNISLLISKAQITLVCLKY